MVILSFFLSLSLSHPSAGPHPLAVSCLQWLCPSVL